jgi:DNA polymerase III alpha subunit
LSTPSCTCTAVSAFSTVSHHRKNWWKPDAVSGLRAVAITDHHGLYGAVRFAEAAAVHQMPTVFGAEFTLGSATPRTDVADPPGEHLLVLREVKRVITRSLGL